MITQSAGLFLREMPANLAEQVASGEYAVFGSIIRSVATGQIKGWLTEAGGMGQVASTALQSSGTAFRSAAALANATPLGLVDAGLNAVQIVQTEQVKAGIETLRQLQIGSLALGAAGVGVSVVGFAVLGRKIDRVGANVDALGDKLDRLAAKLEEVGREPVQRDLDALRTATREMDGGWDLSAGAAARHWEEVARAASGLATSFERRGRELLVGGTNALALAEPMLDALVLAGGLRVSAWAAAGEERYAQRAAAESANALEALTGQIGAADLALDRIRMEGIAPGSKEYREALASATEAAGGSARGLREREAAVSTRGAVLIEAERRGVAARDWMAEAREKTEAPVLLLPAEG